MRFAAESRPDGHQYTVKDQEVHDEAMGQWGILYDDLRARTVRPPGAVPLGDSTG